MKKETIIAVLIGLSLGLFITYGVYQARTNISRRSNEPKLAMTEPTEDFAGELILNSPLDESVQTDDSVIVSGTTLPNSFVVIFVGNEETITTSDNSGNFSVEVSLEEGPNIITVYVIDEDGQTLSVEKTVTTSDETFEEDTVSEPSEN
ncbi:MAG: hypothetical protein A2383_03510 [Candidatus Pacebacteria bacterium RIFOXYB1_FULL_39_46]|nr:MAG: hypothetical protein A2182_03765 [Candidatus Pacebacteria bacterium RIFOXYA1_FULL_38_18]OGJ38484.1 MAG: hypothetical protein A2383_03510 [Candidatus Pacebacteria bacterium RIFOXYB1_FULL_39_46]OGJ40344.1 MAG: hypothetical protein A2411_03650 [Candidatus Pacebacteria bacterium RIFOXYC1_FULL_39_21]OGJ40463.1 MAG: hypothetical protein A2582_02395 [Candidatus Pacebacteria bacterium RIFOXYD1_FULL_39_27]